MFTIGVFWICLGYPVDIEKQCISMRDTWGPYASKLECNQRQEGLPYLVGPTLFSRENIRKKGVSTLSKCTRIIMT